LLLRLSQWIQLYARPVTVVMVAVVQDKVATVGMVGMEVKVGMVEAAVTVAMAATLSSL
jgi:hypothetical protein